jgi:tetratricopeptide (TPR) repeat protein
MANFAAAQALEGNFAEALATIERALRTNPEQLASRSELNRIRGEILSRVGPLEAAETDFREAIALAQRMSAKTWELRATISLAKLLRDTDRVAEARAMLGEIYGWFTKGFDTADLKEAKALLNQLGT